MRRLGVLLTAAVALSSVVAATDALAVDAGVKLQDVPLTIGTPAETPTRVPSLSGTGEEIKIRVNRIWRTGPVTHAAVRVQNTARVEFSDVRVVCTAVDAQNRRIGTATQAVRHERIGAFRPGSIADLDLVFDTRETEVRSLTCDAQARGQPQN